MSLIQTKSSDNLFREWMDNETNDGKNVNFEVGGEHFVPSPPLPDLFESADDYRHLSSLSDIMDMHLV